MVLRSRDIYGAPRRANPLRRRPRSARGARRRDRWDVPAQATRLTTPVLLDPRGRPGFSSRPRLGAPAGAGPRRPGPALFEGRRGRPRRLSPVDRLLALAVLAVAAFLLIGLWRITRVDVRVAGLEDGSVLTAERASGLTVEIAIAQRDRIESATLTFDGKAVEEGARGPSGFRWVAADNLAAGRHELVLTVPRPVLPASTFRWAFEVDASPPVLEAPATVASDGMGSKVLIAGRVDTDAALTANGKEVEVGKDGSFSLRYASPPAGSVLLRAEDPAGHVVLHEVLTPVARPAVRGVHVSAAGWASSELRADILRMIAERRIDTVALDLKDENGEIGYRSQVPLAERIGATRNHYDLTATIDQLHDLGVRVIGRVVAFRDPILAAWAWDGNRRDWVLQRPGGVRHEAYGGFTNFANADVRAYNAAIAIEASKAGIDEILWDYVRRPEGDLSQIVVPGLTGTPEDSIVAFLSETHGQLRALGVFQGASVFGVAAKEPASIGQNVPRMARHLDYLAPMVYPSLFVNGEYRVSNPARRPAEIVTRALQDFQAKAAGTGVVLTPWLQDFSLDGVAYGTAEVRAQIDAANAIGIVSYLLWNPRVRYHTDALPPAG